MASAASPAGKGSDGNERLADALRDTGARREAGEDSSEETVVTAHADLSPELRERLFAQRGLGEPGPHAGGPADSLPSSVSLPEDSSLSVGDSSFDPTADAVVATSFPGYRIVRLIARAGQSVVYQAIQNTTGKRVAIKVMRQGPFAGPRDRMRFDREVHILGQLRHPDIVTILGTGTAFGCLYFVMDYIPGQTLDEWLLGRERSVGEVLRLFARICEAVNAAHLLGVIHRDLKPSNIRIDPEGCPHVLDFGLAKVIGDEPTDESGSVMTTETGQFLGTLPWAGPEQAEEAPSKIDIRTDVYALGVIFYQMLTGRFPYDVTGTMREVQDRIIRDTPIPPRFVRSEIDDEVEAIVLKCLAKERDRRYETAGALARDVRHYLAGETIEAKRDSSIYVLRKTLRRYRIPAAVCLGFVAVITLGLGMSLAFWRHAVLQRDAAEQARRVAECKTLEAEQARAATQREKARADERAEVARRRLYVNQIVLANQSLGMDVHRTKTLLKQCPADLRGWEWERLRWLSDSSRQTLSGHEGSVTAVAFSPNGRTVVSGGSDAVLNLWDLSAGRVLRKLRGHESRVTGVAFSPDGTQVASADEHNGIRLWDAATGRQKRTFLGEGNGFLSVAFAPDGRRIVSGNSQGVLYVWDAVTGQEKLRIHGHNGAVASAAFSPGGERVASGGIDGTLRVWDAATGEPQLTLANHTGPVTAAAFSPDGTRVASAGHDKTIRLWDASNGRGTIILQGHQDGVLAIGFGADGKQLVSASGDGTLKIWNTATGETETTLRGHEGPVLALAVSSDGKDIVSGGGDRVLKVWGADAGADVLLLDERGSSVLAVAVSPDGNRIACARMDGTVGLLDAATGQETLALRRHDRPVSCIAFSPEGMQIVSGSSDNTLRLWDATTGRERITFRGHQGQVSAVSFDPDGSRIISGGSDRVLRLWEASTGAEVRTLRGHAAGITAVAWSPDGIRIASGSWDRSIRLWNAATLEEVRVLHGHAAAVAGLAFSPDGKRIVSASWDRTLKLWDVASGDLLMTLAGHGGHVHSVSFSAGARRIVSGSQDKTLKLWDTATGEELLALFGHGGPVFGVAFSPEGGRIVSCGGDGTVRVWKTSGPARRIATRPVASAGVGAE